MTSHDSPRPVSKFRIELALAVIGTIAAASVSHPRSSSGADGTTPLPIETFARASVGDWAVYSVAATESGRPAQPEFFASRVISVVEGRIVMRIQTRHGRGRVEEGATRELPANRAPTIAELLAPPGVACTFEKVGITTDRFPFEGRSFDGLRITCDRRVGPSLVHLVATASSAIHAGGILEVTATGLEGPGAGTTVVWSLAGFGHGSETTLGHSLEELAAESAVPAR
jgi:hypothetical protein